MNEFLIKYLLDLLIPIQGVLLVLMVDNFLNYKTTMDYRDPYIKRLSNKYFIYYLFFSVLFILIPSKSTIKDFIESDHKYCEMRYSDE